MPSTQYKNDNRNYNRKNHMVVNFILLAVTAFAIGWGISRTTVASNYKVDNDRLNQELQVVEEELDEVKKQSVGLSQHNIELRDQLKQIEARQERERYVGGSGY